MKKIDYERLTEETEVTVAADSPVQTEEYNQLYREWRCRDGNPFSFKGKRIQKLHTYVDGVGVQDNLPEKREKAALKSVCMLITTAVLLYSMAENVLTLPLILLFKAFGVEISYSFDESIAYGNQYAVLCVLIFEGLLKTLLPLFIVNKTLKMPEKVACPMRIRHSWAAASALFTMCIGFFVMGLIKIVLPLDAITVNNIGMTYRHISYMNAGCTAAYFIFEIVIIPVLMELLFHGALFQALRQFGVSFAVLVTAVVGTAIMHDPVSMGTIFVAYLIAGYGIWQSGSMLTGIMVHIAARLMSFLFFQSQEMPDVSGIPMTLMYISVLLVIGLLGWLLLSRSDKKMVHMHDYATFLSLKTKIKMSLWGSSMLAVWTLCFILMLIEIFV